MVKGVNRNVIEINDTGSEVFERIVFFVSPKYGNLTPKKLYKEAERYSFGFEKRAEKGYISLRKRIMKKRRTIWALCAFAGLLIVGGALYILL